MPRTSTTFRKGCSPGPGRPKGSLDRKTIEAREFAARVIDDPDYQARLIERINKGQANHMESLLWHYRYGKPPDKFVVEDDRPAVFVIAMRSPSHDPLAEEDGANERALDVTGLVEPMEARPVRHASPPPRSLGVKRSPTGRRAELLMRPGDDPLGSEDEVGLDADRIFGRGGD